MSASSRARVLQISAPCHLRRQGRGARLSRPGKPTNNAFIEPLFESEMRDIRPVEKTDNSLTSGRRADLARNSYYLRPKELLGMQSTMNAAMGQRFSVIDGLLLKCIKIGVLLLPPLFLAVSCLALSRKRFFDNDELYSYFLLSDPSFWHMWGSFNDAINNSPPLYFGLGWIWAALFGSSETSLRLFSSLAISLAILVLWPIIRRPFGSWPSILGLALAFSTPLVVYQNANARSYGLFLACAALCVATLARNDLRPLSNRSIFLAVACFALLVQSHLFGLIYAVALIGAQVITDFRRSNLRPSLYVAMIAGSGTFALYLPIFFNQAQNGMPRAWIPPAFIQDLNASYASIAPCGLGPVSSFWTVMIVCVSIFATWPQSRQDRAEICQHQQHLLTLAWALFLVPIAIWFGSWLIKPLFVDRYLIPSIIGLAILYAASASRLLGALLSGAQGRVRFGLGAGAGIVAALAGLTALALAERHPNESIPGSEDKQYGYDELPIVVSFSHDYLRRRHYSPNPGRYFFLLDWTTAVDPASGDFAPQAYKELSALKGRYPWQFDTVLDFDDFFALHSRFLVLKPLGTPQTCHPPFSYAEKWSNYYCWQLYDRRIASDRRFHIMQLGPIDGKSELILVERN